MYRVIALSLVLCVVYLTPAEAASGYVSGTVTRTATSAPVPFVQMALCTPSFSCQYETTDASGVYVFTVDPGTYYLSTSNGQGLIDEFYNNVQCAGYCDVYYVVTNGTPIVVTSGATAAGRNFSLADGGSVAGTVTNAVTTAGVPGVYVYLYTRVYGQIYYASAGLSDATGAYTVPGLASGTYYAVAENSAGLINEIYDDLPCTGQCVYWNIDSIGTPIAVTAGATTPNRNFALAPGGSITGTVRNSATSAPIQNIRVNVVTSTAAGWTLAGNVPTNASGAYTLGGLPSGTYYAYTSNNLGYLNEYFDNLPCGGDCSATPPPGATPIAVTSPSAAAGRNFALDVGGIISGTIVNSVTGLPVANTGLSAYRKDGPGDFSHVRSGGSNASGAYAINGLPTGTYYLLTANNAGLVNEVFDNIQCVGGCNDAALDRGVPVSVTAGATTTGKDFGLEPGGSITGTARTIPGDAIPGTYVYAYARDAYGNIIYVTAVPPNAGGVYTVGGLLGGTYYLAVNAPGHLNEIYSGVQCLGVCSGGHAASAGTPVAVTTQLTTANINFALKPSGRITGVLRNAATMAPLINVNVQAIRMLGTGSVHNIASAYTDGSGAYSLSGLTAGDYYVHTNVDGFQNQAHAGLNCQGFCDADLVPAHGTPIPVASGATTGGIDFALNPFGASVKIAGYVRDATTSAPLSGLVVYAFAKSGADFQFSGWNTTSGAGGYEIRLPPGTYYLAVRGDAHVGEIYDNIPCWSTCLEGAGAAALGAPLVLTTGTVTADFALQPLPALPPGPPDELWGRVQGGTVMLEWYKSRWGLPHTDFILEVGLSPGATMLSMPVAGNTFQTSGVPAGRYFLRVRGRNAAGVGPPSGEFELTVNPDGSGAPGDPYSLRMYIESGRLYVDWSEPWYGGFPTGYLLEAGTASGLSNLGTFNVGSSTHFELAPPPPPGLYFVRVRGRNAQSVGKPSREAMLVVGGLPAPPEAPGNVGLHVDSARNVTVAWTPPRGPVTGYMLEAGRATGRYDLGAFTFPASQTSLTTGPVPPGIYFVRMRAINASGTGVPGGERILIVP